MEKEKYTPQYRAEFHTPDNLLVELRSDTPGNIEKGIRALCPDNRLRFDDDTTPGTIHIWSTANGEYLGQIAEFKMPLESTVKAQVANRKTVARAA
jgi:hypothetical protein